MIIGLLASILYAGYSLIKKYNAIYFLPTFLLLNAIGDIFGGDNELVKWLKYAVILFSLVRVLNLQMIKKYSFVFLFIVYLAILVILNSISFFYSLKMFFILLFTFLMLPVSEIVMRKCFSEKLFLKNLTIMMILMPSYLLLANAYGGENLRNSYSDEFAGGLLSTTSANLFPMVIITSIYYLLKPKLIKGINRYISIGLITFAAISLLVIFRRTPLVMLLLSLFLFIYYYKIYSILKGMIVLVVLSSFLLFNSKVYSIFQAQLNAREDISKMSSYSKEGRVVETKLVYDYLLNEASTMEVLFGLEALSTREFGRRKFGATRSIHSDINGFFVTIGIVGFLLFILVVRKFVVKTIPKDENKGIYLALMFIFLLTLIPGRFVSSITFSLPIFLFLGYFRFLGKAQSHIQFYQNSSSINK